MTPPDGSDGPRRPGGRARAVALAEPAPGPGPEAGPAAAVDASVLCPYLQTLQGAWRAGFAVREHRCGAVDPPVPLALEKQRRLCLTPAHEGCATYLAARAARRHAAGEAPTSADGGSSTRRRPMARTTPVLLEPGHGPMRLPVAAGRSLGQVGLVALLVVAFVLIAVARLSVDRGGAAAGRSPSASATAAPTESPTPSPSTTPEPSPSPSPSPVLTPAPTTAPPVVNRTYRVRSGDTLTSIAAKFGTTSKAIQRLNGIASPNLIHVGQLLKIP